MTALNDFYWLLNMTWTLLVRSEVSTPHPPLVDIAPHGTVLPAALGDERLKLRPLIGP